MRYMNKSYISPVFIVFFSWTIIFSGLFWGNLGFYEISDEVIILYALWLIFFATGYETTRLIKVKAIKGNNVGYNKNIFEILYKISLFITPFLIINILRIIINGGGNIFYALRASNLGIEDAEKGIGFLEYFNPIVLILFLSELYFYQKGKSTRRIFVLLVINLLFVFATMAKTNIIYLIVSSIVILYYKKSISLIQIFYYSLLLLFLMAIIHLSRGSYEDDRILDIVIDVFKIYIFAGVPAMDQLIEQQVSTGLWGESVFSSFYKLFNILGFDFQFGKGTEFIGIEGYAMTPYPTNVFTVLSTYYIDFKIVGIVIFGFLTGLYSSFLYKLARNNHTWALILYSLIATSLAFQFFADFIFSMLSQSIQFLLWTILLYKSNYRPKYKITIGKKIQLFKM